MGLPTEWPLTILCVEDDEDICLVIQIALQLDPLISVVAAGSAEAAKELVAAGDRFDLALVDVRLPGAGGLQLAKWLMKLDGHAPIPTILLTADVGARLAYQDVGAIGLILKPFDPLSLAAQVRELAGSVRAQNAPVC